MALYAMADLHLSLSIDKPMDVFGGEWEGYMSKIEEAWTKKIKHDDYILVPGDISWATYLDEIYRDFDYIDRLPGIKILLKGNHDYWWTTSNKLNKYVNKNDFSSISFLHNNSVLYKDIAICGTRGWNCPGSEGFTQEDQKIYLRELQRLELSIKEGLKYNPREIIAMLHYPPFSKYKDLDTGFIEILQKYNVNTCIYGHLHGYSQNNAVIGINEGIMFQLVASDYLKFNPLLIRN